MHRIKKTGDIEILSMIKKTSFMGKPYYLLIYPQGNFLLTKSEFSKIKSKKIGKITHRITMPYSIRDKGYYRYINFMSKHPTFVERTGK